MSGFKGKVAIITGSSRGIGKAIALELAKKGAFIVLNGRNSSRLQSVLEEVSKIQSKVVSYCCDVCNADQSVELIKTAISNFGKLDILINNVGVSMRGEVAT